jgi:hypothetical protein
LSDLCCSRIEGEIIMIDHIEQDVEDNEQDIEDADPYEAPLAKEFAQLCQDVGLQIKVKVAEAQKALREAEEIADKHGVPFRSSISPLSNSYVPGSFSKTKFVKLDQEVVCEIAGVWGDYIGELLGGDRGGWVASAVC